MAFSCSSFHAMVKISSYSFGTTKPSANEFGKENKSVNGDFTGDFGDDFKEPKSKQISYPKVEW